ncbi:hypothetical protein DL96DRAFT_809721 [Flagelloscypha sp. PMI_526]|nr:hypothetical protein DL96DRAFT_809721 [Flagelloscypha sp. PMI_526]
MKFFSFVIAAFSASALASVVVPEARNIDAGEIATRENGELAARDEIISCYNAGTVHDRSALDHAIDEFCANHLGWHLDAGQEVGVRYYTGITVYVSGKAINGCNWIIDSNCYRLLHNIAGTCSSGTGRSQGGFSIDPCGEWRVDPGSNGSDF